MRCAVSHTQTPSLTQSDSCLQAQRLLKEVGLPNSYTLTKHMCEDLLEELHCKKFPVCITRPTIIGAIAHLPVPGYFGNAAGLTSATLAFATGELSQLMHAGDNHQHSPRDSKAGCALRYRFIMLTSQVLGQRC